VVNRWLKVKAELSQSQAFGIKMQKGIYKHYQGDGLKNDI
jgi:hypothetical protein